MVEINMSILRENFSPEVQKLFDLGHPSDIDLEDRNNLHSKLGITKNHTDELLKIVENTNEFTKYSIEKGDKEEGKTDHIFFVPIYAMEILVCFGDLRVLKLAVLNFENDIDNDWLGSDIVDIPQSLGEGSFDIVKELLAFYISKYQKEEDHSSIYVLMTLLESLEKLCQVCPELLADSKELVHGYLKEYRNLNREINAALISFLYEFKSIESIDLIREVYEENDEDGDPIYVDEDYIGRIHEVEYRFGLMEEDEYNRLVKEHFERFQEHFNSNSFSSREINKKFFTFIEERISKERKKQKKKDARKRQKSSRRKNRK